MSQNSCCVPGCSVRREDGVSLHRFPNPDQDAEGFNSWIANIGGEISTLDKHSIFENRRVCHRHFENIHKYPKNRLSKLAIPVLYMPSQGPILFRNVEPELPSASYLANIEKSVDIPGLGNIKQGEQSPTIRVYPGAQHTQLIIKTSELKSKGPSMEPILPSTSFDENIQMNVLKSGHDNIHQKEEPSKIQVYKCRKLKGHCVPLKENEAFQTVLRKLQKCQSENSSLKKKYFYAKKMTNTTAFNIIAKKMSPTAKLVCQMQATQSGKKKEGRRFSLDEKILALSLYKPSPKAYRLLSKLIILPSRRTLQSLLNKVDLKAGINIIIFKNLKNRVASMPESHKYCSLIFDEMAIGPSVFYDKKKDKITGFVENGEYTEREFSDHVLVFMIRGIVKKYKQPLAYYFCSGSTKATILKKQIKEIIHEIQETGLKVVATICDQGTSNVSAINQLLLETRERFMRIGTLSNTTNTEGYFEIGNDKIFPIFDPPHLIKGIRNNLLTKDLHFVMKGKERVAKWSHIFALYKRSLNFDGVKLIPKLTAQHVIPDLIPKMRVKHCTQVFSQSVAVALGLMAELGAFPKEYVDTAHLLKFFDNLFDSLNGSYSKIRGGKIYRAAVTPSSPHHKLWNESLPILKSMKFVNANNRGVVPSLSSWIKTIENIKRIVKYLRNKSVNSLLLRNLNQDSLENFFGAIRAHGYSNIMPTSSAFESAFKTLLINNISSSHSVGSNCQKDDSVCLQSLKHFLEMPGGNTPTECEDEIEDAHLCLDIINTEELLSSSDLLNIERSAAIGYCSGWIAHLAKKNIFKNCTVCKNDLEMETLQNFHQFIKKKEFDNKKWLCYPTRELFDLFAHIENIVRLILDKSCTKRNLANYIKLIININLSINFLNCPQHKNQLSEYLINKCTLFFINNWTKEINNIITGKTTEYSGNVLIKEKASRHYSKNRGRKRKRQNETMLNV